jgi:tetratricopeptide (TPR) repeat protein
MNRCKANNIVLFNRDPETFFRVGLRYASSGKYEKALKFLRKAAQDEPYNADYQLNFACVLSELHETDKSNKVLLNIIKCIDPTLAECYFGLACNYFDIGDFKKAREYFEKYICYDKEGYYTEEAYDILYYLQIYDGTKRDVCNTRTISRLETEGKKLMERSNYKDAIIKLEKIIEIEPEVIPPRNNLSLAYFLTGEIDKAVSMAKSVLKLDIENVSAHCNLALFYAKDRELYKKQMELLSCLEIDNKRDLMKVLFTCAELKEDAGMASALESYLKNIKSARQTLRSVMSNKDVEHRVKTAIEKALSAKRPRLARKQVNIETADKVVNLKKRTKH